MGLTQICAEISRHQGSGGMGQRKRQLFIPATGSMTAEIDKYAVAGAGSVRQLFDFMQDPKLDGFFIYEGMDIVFFEINCVASISESAATS